MTLKCTACQKQLKHPPYDLGEMDLVPQDPAHPVCPVCGGLHFEWAYTHPIEFDYYYQVYRDTNSCPVDIDYEAYPCPSCKSPARLTGVNPYAEHYVCGTCNRDFDVK
jgi:hypothetical protein